MDKRAMRRWLRTCTEAHLDEFIGVYSPGRKEHAWAIEERHRRAILMMQGSRPIERWFLAVMLVTMIFAALAAWPVIREWLR